MKKNKVAWQFQLVNVRLLGGDPVCIVVQEGIITHVGAQQGWPNLINGRGLSIFPGRIDSHVHDRYPGEGKSENIESVQEAAIAGGTTTIMTMANTNPCITTADRFCEKIAAVSKSRVEHHQWFGATASNYDEFRKISHIPECFGAKLCMANTTGTGEMLVDRRADQLTWCRLAAEHGKVLTVHAELEARIAANTKRLKKQAAQHGLPVHCDIRDVQAELEAVQQILELGLKAGCRLNICHVSTAAAAREILRIAQKGLLVTFELCPQYWRLTHHDLEGQEGWRAKCNPPVRTPEDAQYLQALLCDPNFPLAFEATDHAPHVGAEKRKHHPDPFKVPSGLPGLDTATNLCWDLVHHGKMTRERFAAVTSFLPAQALGLKNKGSIAPGYDADLILIDEQAPVAIRDEDMLTKCGWTPFHGTLTHGAIKLVIARGQVLLNRL